VLGVIAAAALSASVYAATPDDGAVDSSVGPWYYDLEGKPPADEKRNGVTWTYVGQHVFDNPDYVPPLDEREDLTGVQLQMAAIRVDNLGRECML
jgi:hypothetical protein